MINQGQKQKYGYLKRFLLLTLLLAVTFIGAFSAPDFHDSVTVKVYRIAENKTLFPALKQDTGSQPKQSEIKADQQSDTARSRAFKPLFVLDGQLLPANLNLDSVITPEEIESVNVLKGKSALDAYGAKGKNGVVEIRSKAAKKNLPTGQTTANISTLAIYHPKRDPNQKIKFASDGPRPLYIIDGQEASDDTLKSIDPSQIASIHVYKDATATLKYGDKGQNGVIEIKTKDHLADSTKPIATSGPGRQKNMTAPGFPGGEKAWKYFLDKNLKYEVPVTHGAPAGTYDIIVSFLISETGDVSEVTAISKPDIDYGCAAEAVRLIKTSGKWIPATEDGKKVIYRNRQKISFVVDK